jgi:RNA polymerase sigma-70 factor, ECF subfamily
MLARGRHSKQEMDEWTDAVLVRRASDDAHAFRVLYDRHCSRLYAFFAGRTHDHHAALDLTAETFARAWDGRKRFEDRCNGSAAPWLFGIARNVLSRSVRERRLTLEAMTRLGVQRAASGDVDVPADWLDGLDADIAAALAKLPPEQRDAVERRIMHDESYETIADDANCTPGTARVRVFRGLRSVRSDLRGSS